MTHKRFVTTKVEIEGRAETSGSDQAATATPSGSGRPSRTVSADRKSVV